MFSCEKCEKQYAYLHKLNFLSIKESIEVLLGPFLSSLLTAKYSPLLGQNID